MLSKKMQSALELIQDVDDNKNKKKEYESIAQRNTVFFDSYDKLTSNIASYILAHNCFKFTQQSKVLDEMKSLVEYVNISFQSEKAVNPQSFESKVNDLVKCLSDEWVQFFDRRFGILISDLNIMTTFYHNPKIIRNYISALKKCSKFALNGAEIQNCLLAENKGKELIKEFKFDGHIKSFLQKVSSQKATINDVTPDIYKWIFDEGISDKIGLIIKTS